MVEAKTPIEAIAKFSRNEPRLPEGVIFTDSGSIAPKVRMTPDMQKP